MSLSLQLPPGAIQHARHNYMMKHFVRDSSYAVVSAGLQLVLSLLSGIVLARVLGPAGRGTVTLAIQFATLASLIVSAGLGTSYQYHLCSGRMPLERILSHLLAQVLLVAGVCAALTVVGGAALRPLLGTAADGRLLPLVAALLVLNVAYQYVSAVLMGLPRGIPRSNVISLASNGLYLVLLAVLCWSLHLGPVGAVVAYLIGIIARLVPSAWLIAHRRWPRVDRHWLSTSRILLPFGLSSLAGNLMISFVFRADVFVLNAFKGASAVGIYAIAVSMAELLQMAPNAIGSVLFPHLTASSQESRWRLVCQVTRLTTGFAFVISLALVVVGAPLITLLFGERFALAAGPLRLLIPGVLAMPLNFAISNYFSSHGRAGLNAMVFGGGFVLNMLVNLFTIPRWGPSGAALASSLTYISIAVCYVILLRPQETFTLRELLVPSKADLGQLSGLASRLRPVRPPASVG